MLLFLKSQIPPGAKERVQVAAVFFFLKSQISNPLRDKRAGASGGDIVLLFPPEGGGA
jgi:hypothetical protein